MQMYQHEYISNLPTSDCESKVLAKVAWQSLKWNEEGAAQKHTSLLEEGSLVIRAERATVVWMLSLTGGSFSIVSGVYVPFALTPFCPRHFLHAVNFRNTQFGIESEVHFSRFDGQVAVVPVPQLLQVLVVQDIEGIVPGSTEIDIIVPAHVHVPPPACWPHKHRSSLHVSYHNIFPSPIRDLLIDAM